MIIPSASVRRSSDLPDPVAPTHNPCGPIPFRAASLMSRCTRRAVFDATPMGTGRYARRRLSANVPRDCMRTRIVDTHQTQPIERFARPSSSVDLPTGRYGASRRAHTVACAVRQRVGPRNHLIAVWPADITVRD